MPADPTRGRGIWLRVRRMSDIFYFIYVWERDGVVVGILDGLCVV